METLDPNYLGETEDEIYKENILDHFRHPRNFGELETTYKHREYNPVCGDDIEIFLIMEDNKVKDIKFTGKGCAISMAAASMLTDHIKNKTLEEIKSLTEENITNLLGIKLGIVRMKCASLSLNALNKALGVKNEINN